jgi:FlgD Ig-like domain
MMSSQEAPFGVRRSSISRRSLAMLSFAALAIATGALSDERFVTEARQTAWVLAPGGGRLTGGPMVSTATVGEGFVSAELRGTNRVLQAGFHAQTKFLSPTLGIEPEAAGSPIRASRIVGNAPNPFNPATTIKFDLAAGGAAALRIYDVRGRLVRTLVDGPMAAGAHQISWDGRSNAGSAVASGVYLLEMVAGGKRDDMKLVLAR